ncbi:hypothetical protein DXG01_013734 [Tephrocybe rancida]|nr:hypothetical protein DXG01_013734 [Tephrocybe rancida]
MPSTQPTSTPEPLSLPVRASPPPSLPSSSSHSLPSTPSIDEDGPSSDVDPQILEALRNKDRLYVLKLGEQMEGLINDRRTRIDLTPSTSYQRLLVHRCSAFYKLTPESDPNSKGIIVTSTTDSRIPARRLCDLVPPESTTAPAFKIMRRSADRRPGRQQSSHAGSVAGDDADLSDQDPSESGSQGGRSNATGRSSNKSRMTIEEREAAYNEARSRIFMGFEEKEKEKDMSASSSSLSLVSGFASTSAGGGSSVSGDPEESVSSPATESEFSGPTGPISAREKKDAVRSYGKNASASSSTRSLRGGGGGGPSSSRNSRAPSPSSFSYPNIYEPPHGIAYYDPTAQVAHGYATHAHGAYPYPPYVPTGPPGNYYGSQYPFYPPYAPYPASEPPTPASDPYMSPPPNGATVYPQQYGWPPPQHPPHMHQQQHHPPPPPPPQYPYMHPPHHGYTYPPVQAYYPAPPPIESPPAQHAHGAYDVPRTMNGHGQGQGQQGHGRNGSPAGNGHGQQQQLHNGNGNVGRGGNRPNSVSGVGGKGRGPPPMNQVRSPWSYGPGVSQGGHVTSPTETIGPRLNNSRRTSNNSIGSSATSRSSNCDDGLSTAVRASSPYRRLDVLTLHLQSSSTTSSSSRRTYTSTTSSQHPLPARPDWAVGLKPQPTLHATQSRHHAPSPAQQQQPVPLQSPTEFPPLSSASATTPEKRVPVVSGAWGNPASARSIRQPPPPPQTTTTASMPAPVSAPVPAQPEGTEEFERPPPKSPAELFNPKLLKRAGPGKAPPPPAHQEKEMSTSPVQRGSERERARGDMVSSAILVEQVEALALDAPGVVGEKQPLAV